MALTQPEQGIVVRWMGLETQWKTSWKHGCVWNDFIHGCKFSSVKHLICAQFYHVLICYQHLHETDWKHKLHRGNGRFCVSLLWSCTYLAKFYSNCLYPQDIYRMNFLRIWLKIESFHTFPKNLNKTNIHINESGVMLLANFVTYMFYNTWLIL